jgi:hypothetical protein
MEVEKERVRSSKKKSKETESAVYRVAASRLHGDFLSSLGDIQ